MNKRTVLAFALILLTIALFSSEHYNNFFYNRILNRPSPQQIAREQREREEAIADSLEEIAGVEGEAGVEAQAGEDRQGEGRDGAPEPEIPPESKIPDVAIGERDLGDGGENDSVAKGLEADTMWVETEDLLIGLSTRGGRLVSIKTKNYHYERGRRDEGDTVRTPIELIPKGSAGAGNLYVGNQEYDVVAFDVVGDLPEGIIEEGDSAAVRLVSEDGQIWKEYRFFGAGYGIGLEVGGTVIRGKKVYVGWDGGITESEEREGKKEKQQRGVQNARVVHLSDGKGVQHVQHKKIEKDVETGFYQWIAVTSKYFLNGIVSEEAGDVEMSIVSRKESGAEKKEDGKSSPDDLNYAIGLIRASDDTSLQYTLYAGPSQLEALKGQDVGLEKALFGSPEGTFSHGFSKFFFRADVWFPYLTEFVLWLLIQLHKLLNDYGLVIICLTLLSKLVTFPLTQSSTKSMSRMKDLQPKINAIRGRYKSNPKKMNEEIFALYRSEGVNPLNPGCLPMVLQMPIFFSLFVVLRKAIELRGATTVLVPWVRDLSAPEALPIITPAFQSIFPNGLPMYGDTVGLLPILMGVLMYFQNKMTIKDPNQKAMIYFMPIFMTVLFNSFSSGLVFYWIFSSLFAIVQQYYTEHSKKKRGETAAVTVSGTPRGTPHRGRKKR